MTQTPNLAWTDHKSIEVRRAQSGESQDSEDDVNRSEGHKNCNAQEFIEALSPTDVAAHVAQNNSGLHSVALDSLDANEDKATSQPKRNLTTQDSDGDQFVHLGHKN